jgi:hypothetical protein
MPTPTPEQRATLKKFVEKVKRDHAYAKHVRRDPVAALRSAGMEDDMIIEILQEDGFDQLDLNDPRLKPARREAGRMARRPGCTFTCLCSGCCLTPWG